MTEETDRNFFDEVAYKANLEINKVLPDSLQKLQLEACDTLESIPVIGPMYKASCDGVRDAAKETSSR